MTLQRCPGNANVSSCIRIPPHRPPCIGPTKARVGRVRKARSPLGAIIMVCAGLLLGFFGLVGLDLALAMQGWDFPKSMVVAFCTSLLVLHALVIHESGVFSDRAPGNVDSGGGR